MFSLVKKIVLVSGFCMLCAACATQPTEFGMPVSQFNKLSPQQKQAAIAKYNKQQAEKQQFDTALEDIGAVASMVSGSKTIAKTHSKSESSSSTPWECQGDTCTKSSSSHKSSSSSGVSVGF